jgi:3-deoxy-D-manno-octulosonic-acid transferase
MTATGLQMARTKIPEANRHFIVPLDLFFTARRAMRQIRPTLFLTVETEIWPNLLRYAKRYGAAIAMVNGRISVRKIGLYLRYKSFLQKVLRCYDVCSMILPVDAERIIAMGADPKKVSINGNVKFDSLSYQITTKTRSDVLAALHFTGTGKILVAGSTREGEEELILQAYQKIKAVIPNLSLIIAPRHIRRSSEIIALVEQFGFQPLLRTQITKTTVLTPNTIIILDTMGELFNVYAIAKLTFCGGSLVPLGGQNPLEPAAWGKVVLYGPSMEDFLDAKKFLEAVGAGITVRDHVKLAEQVIALLGDEKRLEDLGAAGKQAIEAQKGSSLRNLQLIQKLIIH